MVFQFTSLLSIIRRAFLIACLPISGLSLVAQQQSSEESAAQAAEQAGKPREALTHYVAALQQAALGTDADQHLREKIISLAVKLTPAPVIPDDVRTHMTQGRTAVANAKDTEELRAAVAEFQEASRLAPWLGNIYFNLGAIDQKAGQLDYAIRNFKLYLLASPSASDAAAVKSRIAGLEAKLQLEKGDADRRAKAAADARREQQRKTEAQAAKPAAQPGPLDWLQGRWSMTEALPAAPSMPTIRNLVAEFVKNGKEVRAEWVHEDGSRENLLRAVTDTLGTTRWQSWLKGVSFCNGQADQWINAQVSFSPDHHRITFSRAERVADPDNGCPIAPFEWRVDLER